MTELPSKARWVIVPPFRNDFAWRTAAAEAARAAGFKVHDADKMPEGIPINDGQAVILTADAAKALDCGTPIENISLIIAGVGTSRPATFTAPGPLVAPLTDIMARTGLVPPNRIFRFSDFAHGPLEVLDSIAVRAPMPTPEPPATEYLTALTEAVQLLDPATPTAQWHPALFNYDSRTVPGGATGELDLTGRPRFMITGPYITLPPGHWRAVYRLTFDEPGSRVRFRLDWGSQSDYLSEEFKPGLGGMFEIVQDYIWLNRAPAELRIIALEGIFDGKMTFHGAQVSRIE